MATVAKKCNFKHYEFFYFYSSSGTSADSSSSVTVAMENLSTDPDLASGAMEVDEKDKDAKRPDSNLHHQIKQIKPLLGKFTKK